MANPQPTADAPKAEWRQWAKTLGPVRLDAEREVHAVLQDLLESASGLIAGYRGITGEVSLDPLVDASPSLFLLPRVSGDRLTFHFASHTTETYRGIVQPTADAPVVDESEIEIILVPGRVFDRQGVRLGMGAGHYDRTLGRTYLTARRIGVVTAERVVTALPAEPHDVAMDELLTDEGRWAVPTPRGR